MKDGTLRCLFFKVILSLVISEKLLLAVAVLFKKIADDRIGIFFGNRGFKVYDHLINLVAPEGL